MTPATSAASAATASTATAPRTRLVIVDDHDLARAGLRSILDSEPQMEVVGEATVRSHVSSILRKLQLASRTQAALYALREGLASLDEADLSR